MPGKAKTRLIPALGAEGAAALQQKMTEQVFHEARSLQEDNVGLVVRYAGGSLIQLKDWLAGAYAYLPQCDGDLGARLQEGIAHEFAQGAEQVLVIGADCPTLTVDHLGQAFAALAEHDLTLGPTHDGGYYLLGLAAHSPNLFKDIPWGKDNVMTVTLERAKQLSLSVKTLETLHDIDRPEDLHTLGDYPDPQ